MDYCLSNYIQQLSNTLASRLSDLNKRIAALESKNTIVCTTPVLSLINYTVDITPPIGSIIHYHDINITYSQDAERLWNFVWGGEIGSGTNGQYETVFTFNPDCVVPNGVDNEVTLSQLNFKSPNGSKDEYFQGVLIVNNVNLSFSYNRQLVTYTWDPKTATFQMVFNLQALGKNWKDQVNWNTGPPLSPVAGTNSIYANLYLKDDVSTDVFLLCYYNTNAGFSNLVWADSFPSSNTTYYSIDYYSPSITVTYSTNTIIIYNNETSLATKISVIVCIPGTVNTCSYTSGDPIGAISIYNGTGTTENSTTIKGAVATYDVPGSVSPCTPYSNSTACQLNTLINYSSEDINTGKYFTWTSRNSNCSFTPLVMNPEVFLLCYYNTFAGFSNLVWADSFPSSTTTYYSSIDYYSPSITVTYSTNTIIIYNNETSLATKISVIVCIPGTVNTCSYTSGDPIGAISIYNGTGTTENSTTIKGAVATYDVPGSVSPCTPYSNSTACQLNTLINYSSEDINTGKYFTWTSRNSNCSFTPLVITEYWIWMCYQNSQGWSTSDNDIVIGFAEPFPGDNTSSRVLNVGDIPPLTNTLFEECACVGPNTQRVNIGSFDYNFNFVCVEPYDPNMKQRFCGAYPRTNLQLYTINYNFNDTNQKVYTTQLSDGVALGNPLNDAKYTLNDPYYILRITSAKDSIGKFTFDNNAELVTLTEGRDDAC